jgi:hypothetical protein
VGTLQHILPGWPSFKGVEFLLSHAAVSSLVQTPACMLLFADKNQHRLEEAHAVFQEVQNAYEVLSDKHERAW